MIAQVVCEGVGWTFDRNDPIAGVGGGRLGHQQIKCCGISFSKRNYFYSGSHTHSAFGLPQPEQTSSSMGSSLGVHPHDSHIFFSCNNVNDISHMDLPETEGRQTSDRIGLLLFRLLLA